MPGKLTVKVSLKSWKILIDFSRSSYSGLASRLALTTSMLIFNFEMSDLMRMILSLINLYVMTLQEYFSDLSNQGESEGNIAIFHIKDFI